LQQINAILGVCDLPSNRSIIAYQGRGIMVIFAFFEIRVHPPRACFGPDIKGSPGHFGPEQQEIYIER